MRAQAGYSLVEVVVAFALLALALTILLGAMSGATRQLRWSDEAGRAALHARALLADLGVAEPLRPGRR
ncbi:prepilin-type N-terminal cleavage/methylation domain-containing protein, partial [Novilysobacter defluvii]